MFSIKKLYSFIFLVCFFVSIAVPIFPKITDGMMYHVLIISLLPLLLLPWVLKIRYSFGIHFLFTIFIVILMTSAAIIHEDKVDLASIASSFKVIYFVFYILLGYAFASCSMSSPNSFMKVYNWLLVFALVFGVIELIFPSISYYLYKRENLEILEDKVSSIFNTTYHFAFFLFFGFLYYLNLLFLRLRTSSRKSLAIPLINLCVIFSFILLSQSRMFVITAIFITFFLFLNAMCKANNKLNFLIPATFAVILVSLAIVYFWDEFSERFYYIVYGVDFLLSGKLDFSGDGVGSFNTRINQILFSIDQISNNPFIGVGSGKDLYLESLYSYLLYKYAVPGLFFYFAMIYFICKQAKILVDSNVTQDIRLFFQTCYWFFLLSPLYFLSGPLFEVPKLSLFFFAIIGMLYGYEKNGKMNER